MIEFYDASSLMILAELIASSSSRHRHRLHTIACGTHTTSICVCSSAWPSPNEHAAPETALASFTSTFTSAGDDRKQSTDLMDAWE